jgi:hypothetical protein
MFESERCNPKREIPQDCLGEKIHQESIEELSHGVNRIRRYILDNPLNWANDEGFPGNIRMDRMHQSQEDWSLLD